jgi:hypothetical protein
MKTTLFPIALVLVLASCGRADQSAAPATTASGSHVELQSVLSTPEVEQAAAFADSLAKLPHATLAERKAGTDYTKALATWYESDLSSGIKTHPLVAGIWQNYRTVLRMVAKSRGMKKGKPEDAKNWDELPGECAQIAATLVPLTQDNPAPTSDKAVPQLQNTWDGMMHERVTAERYMMYLEYPNTRNK